jgi:hypothetical protein
VKVLGPMLTVTVLFFLAAFGLARVADVAWDKAAFFALGLTCTATLVLLLGAASSPPREP